MSSSLLSIIYIYINVTYWCQCFTDKSRSSLKEQNKKKIKNTKTSEQFRNRNRKIVEDRGKFDTPSTHILDNSLSLLGTKNTSIEIGGDKLVL